MSKHSNWGVYSASLDGLGNDVLVNFQFWGARLARADGLATLESAQSSFIDLHPICKRTPSGHLSPRSSYQDYQGKVGNYLSG